METWSELHTLQLSLPLRCLRTRNLLSKGNWVRTSNRENDLQERHLRPPAPRVKATSAAPGFEDSGPEGRRHPRRLTRRAVRKGPCCCFPGPFTAGRLVGLLQGGHISGGGGWRAWQAPGEGAHLTPGGSRGPGTRSIRNKGLLTGRGGFSCRAPPIDRVMYDLQVLSRSYTRPQFPHRVL